MEFLNVPIYCALDQYVGVNPVCFSHIYSHGLSVIRNDSGLLCDTYNTVELGETDCTRVSVMDKDHFPQWLESGEIAENPYRIFVLFRVDLSDPPESEEKA